LIGIPIGKNALLALVIVSDRVGALSSYTEKKLRSTGHSYGAGSFQCRTRKPFEVSFLGWLMERTVREVEWGVVFGLGLRSGHETQIICSRPFWS